LAANGWRAQSEMEMPRRQQQQQQQQRPRGDQFNTALL